jgi:hypothetical protein
MADPDDDEGVGGTIVPEPPHPPEAPGHPLTAADAWALVPKETA